MSTVAAPPEEWLSASQAQARLGLPRHRFMNVYKRGVLTIQKYPGCRMRFLAADVERLIAESTRPATSTVGAK